MIRYFNLFLVFTAELSGPKVSPASCLAQTKMLKLLGFDKVVNEAVQEGAKILGEVAVEETQGSLKSAAEGALPDKKEAQLFNSKDPIYWFEYALTGPKILLCVLHWFIANVFGTGIEWLYNKYFEDKFFPWLKSKLGSGQVVDGFLQILKEASRKAVLLIFNSWITRIIAASVFFNILSSTIVSITGLDLKDFNIATWLKMADDAYNNSRSVKTLRKTDNFGFDFTPKNQSKRTMSASSAFNGLLYWIGAGLALIPWIPLIGVWLDGIIRAAAMTIGSVESVFTIGIAYVMSTPNVEVILYKDFSKDKNGKKMTWTESFKEIGKCFHSTCWGSGWYDWQVQGTLPKSAQAPVSSPSSSVSTKSSSGSGSGVSAKKRFSEDLPLMLILAPFAWIPFVFLAGPYCLINRGVPQPPESPPPPKPDTKKEN